MSGQKNVDYLHLSRGLFEINEKILYIAVVDIFGKVIEQYSGNLDTFISKAEVNNQLRNIDLLQTDYLLKMLNLCYWKKII